MLWLYLNVERIIMSATSSISAPTFEHSALDKYQKCLKIGHCLMISALLMGMLCITVSFIIDSRFSLGVQILAHLGALLFAGLLKIGYVIRCIGAHGLRHRSF
jgi:hypothetical protein